MATFKEPVRSCDTTSGLVAATNAGGASGPCTPVDRIRIVGAANAAAANILTITNASHGQATTLTIPDVGAATGAVVLAADSTAAATFSGITAGTAAANKALVLGASKEIATITSATITTMTGNVTGNVTGYVVGKVSASQSTITAAAGAANVATVTVQLKDGAGSNLTGVNSFTVYASSAADGLTLASAASTGWSVASGGLSVNNGTAITTSIRAVSSATGGCVLSLTDTGKQTSYLVLVTSDGVKISAQLSAGSYG